MVQGCDGRFVDTGIEGQTHQDTDNLSDEEGPPDIVDVAGPGQQPGCRQQHKQLTAHRHDEAEQAVAQGLEHGAQHDAGACQQKVQADDPHGRDADGQHGLAGREQPQHLAGEELKRYSFDGYRGKIETFLFPFSLPGMVAELDDPVYQERNGTYFIESTEVSFSTQGARRTVELGIKA